ncbi:hypothetical protein [Herbiconiux sp. A18JL235]|uniref:Uncharacterized protein n=1 Tax=Herbiconiux sp. A18JL235 TaxID=3152363 RepID=A0AB39BKI1_9MICO
MTVDRWLLVFGVLSIALLVVGAVCLVSSSARLVGGALVLVGVGVGAFCAGFAASRRRGVRWTDAPPRKPSR